MRIVVGIGSEQDVKAIASFLSAVPESAEVAAAAVVPRHSLLDTMPPYPWRLRTWRRFLKEAEKIEREHASELLDDFRSSAVSSVADVQTTVLRGDPARQLITTARRQGADFIMVVRRQKSDVGTSPLGHVASRIARYAPCSVLVLNPESPVPGVCLLATDGSSQASLAGERLRNLLARGRRNLLVCTIAPSFNATFVKTGSLAYADYERFLADIRETQKAAAQAIVNREGAAFQGSAFDIKKLAYTGEAVAVLSRAIEEFHVGLLAMGAKGLSAPSRFLLGSVSWRLLNRITCSMLISR